MILCCCVEENFVSAFQVELSIFLIHCKMYIEGLREALHCECSAFDGPSSLGSLNLTPQGRLKYFFVFVECHIYYLKASKSEGPPIWYCLSFCILQFSSYFTHTYVSFLDVGHSWEFPKYSIYTHFVKHCSLGGRWWDRSLLWNKAVCPCSVWSLCTHAFFASSPSICILGPCSLFRCYKH